jgi:hypothetical protein
MTAVGDLTWSQEMLASLSPGKFLSIRASPADRLGTELGQMILRV